MIHGMNRHHPGPRHPVLSSARLSTELAALPRRRREREFVKIADELWLPAGCPLSFETLSVAYSRLYPNGVLTGWSAAVLHGIAAPGDAIPELCVGPSGRKRAGLRIRRYRLPATAVEQKRGVAVTTRRWTAFDLARFADHLGGVLAVEHFYRHGFSERELREVVDGQVGGWGIARVRRVLADADRRSESPMETETRLFLRDAGFTGFIPQVDVGGYRLDLADPIHKIAVEYDGAHHENPEQRSKDRYRRNRLQAAGWIVIVVDHKILRLHRDDILRQVRTAYAHRIAGVAA
jgi:very-short-patch-repair endonuclease